MDTEALPKAYVSRRKRGISPVWVVPIAALIAAAWLVYQGVVEKGPTITIHFDSAEGIEPGKTRLKYLSVDLGAVSAIRFSKAGGVEVEAQLMPGTESKLTDTTRFWIVRPRLEATGVSGLGTLFSGAYIGMDPGEGGDGRRLFKALNDAPRILSHQSGSLFKLWSPELGSLSIGSPVYFRQIPVGSVVNYALAEDHTHVLIEVFIEAPHNSFVDAGSRFWNVSGVQVDASSDGLQIDLESLVSLASGGVAFDVPQVPVANGAADGVPEDHLFTLYDSRRDSQQQAVVGTYPFLVYFDESVRGLRANAGVEFRGVRVGAVKSILPVTDIKRGEVRIPVLIGLDPELLPFETASEKSNGWEKRMEWVQRLADRGARAQLKTGNLLTGQKYVDLDIYPAAKPVQVGDALGYPVIPSVPGALQGMTASVAGILARLETLPLEEMGRDLGGTLRGVNTLVNSSDLTRAMQNLSAASAELQTLMGNASAASAELVTLSNNASGALSQFETTLRSLQSTTSEDGVIGNEVLGALQEMSAAARAIRVMAEYLQRHPEALVSGKK